MLSESKLILHSNVLHLYLTLWGNFSLFSILFSSRAQKAKKVTFFPLDVFKRIFYFRLLICVFVFLFGCVVLLCFWCFWCFWCVQNFFVKKNKGFKAVLITSFILLLWISSWWCKRVKFLTYWVGNIIFPPVWTTSLKIFCDNWTNRNFFFYIAE